MTAIFDDEQIDLTTHRTSIIKVWVSKSERGNQVVITLYHPEECGDLDREQNAVLHDIAAKAWRTTNYRSHVRGDAVFIMAPQVSRVSVVKMLRAMNLEVA